MSASSSSNSSTFLSRVNGLPALFSALDTKEGQQELSCELNWDNLGLDEVKFVIGLQDGSGHEFYLHENNTLVSLQDRQAAKPRIVQTGQLKEKLEIIRRHYSMYNLVYGLTLLDFNQRRNAI